MITHNAGIADMADRVLYFRDGRLDHVHENAQRKRPEDITW